MNKISKRIMAVVLVFSLTMIGGTTAFAANATNEVEGLISPEELAELGNQDASTRASDTYVYVTGHNTFYPYSQSDFSQGNGCGPTAVANLLSYFQWSRGVGLFSGDYITQGIYNQICSDVGWSTSGTSMEGASNGLKTFSNRAGRTCNQDTYLLNLWSDVTRDIGANKPILTNDITQNHIMVIYGYAIINGEKYVYVCTGTDDKLFGYIKWGQDTLRMRAVSIY